MPAADRIAVQPIDAASVGERHGALLRAWVALVDDRDRRLAEDEHRRLAEQWAAHRRQHLGEGVASDAGDHA